MTEKEFSRRNDLPPDTPNDWHAGLGGAQSQRLPEANNRFKDTVDPHADRRADRQNGVRYQGRKF